MRRSGNVVLALLTAALGGACTQSPGDPATDSGPGPGDAAGRDGGNVDAGADGDAMAAAGLGIDFGSDPQLPADVGGDFAPQVFQIASLKLKDLKAVGEASMGDDTTDPDVDLEWGMEGGGDDDGGEGEVAGELLAEDSDDIHVFFDTAPPGIYSNVLGQVVTYRLTGTVTVNQVATPFEVVDTPPTPLAVSVFLGNFQLDANTNRIISLKARLADAVREPRWDEVPLVGGVRYIDRDSPQIASIRERVRTAFVFDQAGTL